MIFVVCRKFIAASLRPRRRWRVEITASKPKNLVPALAILMRFRNVFVEFTPERSGCQLRQTSACLSINSRFSDENVEIGSLTIIEKSPGRI